MEERKKEGRGKRGKENKDVDSNSSRGSSARGTPTANMASSGQSSSAPNSRPLSRDHTPKPSENLPKFTYSRVSILLFFEINIWQVAFSDKSECR